MTMDGAAAKKNIFVVLGMARSGTSAITRGLTALGIDLGSTLTGTGPLNRWNPKGFYEDSDIVYKINRGVSYALDDVWMSLHLIDKQCKNNPALNTLKISAAELLAERLQNTQYWGFKDPRTSRILPFWQEVFASLNVNDNYIIALRNPLASASSWQRLSKTDIEIGLLLWMMHLIPAVNGTQDRRRLVVSYDLVLQHPQEQLERIKQHFNVTAPVDAAKMHEYAHDFLDKKLQHYECSDDDLKSHPASAVAPLAIKIYALLMKLAKDELASDSDEFKSVWQGLMKEFEAIYPTYFYMDVLLKRHKILERKLRNIQKSIPWKLLYPLRVIDDALRARRTKKRQQKRLLTSHG